jgi:hypothetical protein
MSTTSPPTLTLVPCEPDSKDPSVQQFLAAFNAAAAGDSNVVDALLVGCEHGTLIELTPHLAAWVILNDIRGRPYIAALLAYTTYLSSTCPGWVHGLLGALLRYPESPELIDAVRNDLPRLLAAAPTNRLGNWADVTLSAFNSGMAQMLVEEGQPLPTTTSETLFSRRNLYHDTKTEHEALLAWENHPKYQDALAYVLSVHPVFQ